MMKADELQGKIKEILTNNWSIQLYLVMKKKDSYIIRKADLDNGTTTTDMQRMFGAYIKDSIIENDLFSICPLSTADERLNAIYEYDYDEYPEDIYFFKEFDIQSAVYENVFSFADDDLKNLYGYIIYMGTMNNGIVLFKKHYAISLIKRDSFLLFRKEQRFVKFEGDDIIRLNPSVQLIKIDNNIFIIDLNMFEKNCGFHDLIYKRANDTIHQIEEINILEDIEVLRDAAEDISFSRKLSKVKDTSPIINLHIPNETVIQFTKNHPGLNGKLKYSNDGKQIRLDTKASKIAFLKLLNDDYLKSELSRQYYDSLAKDRVQ